MKNVDECYIELLQHAATAQENAYSPYSKYKVGAALITKSKKIIVGSNVENASYGLTICAERSAIFSAISQGTKPIDIVAIAISAGGVNFSPCGACRQVIYEMGSEIKVVFRFNGSIIIESIKNLMPYSFGDIYGK